jgi:acylphosphatase
MPEEIVRLLRIRGRVQGVGYRAFLRDRAAALGLSGWTRNRLDGSVEASVRGEAGAIETLVEALRRGPSGSRVAEIDQRVGALDDQTGEDGEFQILPTA